MKKWCILKSKKCGNNLITIKSNSHLGEWDQLCANTPMKQLANCGRYIKRCIGKLQHKNTYAPIDRPLHPLYEPKGEFLLLV